MDVAEQKNDSETSEDSKCEDLSHREQNGDPSANKCTTSDAIVKDLLDEVRSLEKPFSVEDLAAQKKRDKEKKKKEHKHKKSKKKKKKHHSKRDHSGSRKHSRSRSPSKKKHKKRKHRSRSKSKTSSKDKTPSRTPTPLRSDNEEEKKAVVKPEPEPVSTPERSPPFPEKSSFRAISDDDDDLPVGADFRTVMKEAKKKINISSKIGSSLDLASLPVAPPLGKSRSANAFPLSKEIKKDLDDDGPMEKRESDVLNKVFRSCKERKVIAEKGRGDFVPRNLKVKTSATESSSVQTHVKTETENGNETDLKPSIKIEDESLMDISADEADKEAEFGPASLPPPVPSASSSGAVNSAPVPEPISDGELEKEIAEEINAAAQPKE